MSFQTASVQPSGRGLLPFVYILKKRAHAMMDEKLNFSYLFGSNAPYIEELYEAFLENPDAV
ncbi:TPA: hypothetical protein ACE77M_000659, partial [Neisseria gonorrhoeae]